MIMVSIHKIYTKTGIIITGKNLLLMMESLEDKSRHLLQISIILTITSKTKEEGVLMDNREMILEIKSNRTMTSKIRK